MKKLMYGMALMMCVMEWACSSGERLLPEKSEEGRISLRAGIQSFTRAPLEDEDGSGVFADGDRLKLLVTDETERLSSLDYTVGSTELYWRNIEVGEPGGQVTFAACYPSQEITDGQFVFDLENTDDRNLLLARTSGVEVGTESPVYLNFRHAMCRLVIRYTVDATPDGREEKELVTDCAALSRCKVNLLDGTLDSSSSPQALFTVSGKYAVFLLVPQRASDIRLSVRLGEEVCQVSLDQLVGKEMKLESGNQLILNLTLKDGRLWLGDFVIEGWDNQGVFDQSIEM